MESIAHTLRQKQYLLKLFPTFCLLIISTIPRDAFEKKIYQNGNSLPLHKALRSSSAAAAVVKIRFVGTVMGQLLHLSNCFLEVDPKFVTLHHLVRFKNTNK
jgi:hypothetical protein